MAHDFEKSGPFIALGGFAVAFFLYAYVAIAMPSWLNSLVLPLVWLALLVVCLRWFTRRPKAAIALPVFALAGGLAAGLLARGWRYSGGDAHQHPRGEQVCSGPGNVPSATSAA